MAGYPPRESIPFNRPFVTGMELKYLCEAVEDGHLSGNGRFANLCSNWLRREIGSAAAFMTPSCTAALEMAMLLAGVGPRDEVIMPSFSFVSTANAVALRGGTPVFIDVRDDTLNIDEQLIEAAITRRTKAILVVHYAGVACEMRAIRDIADCHGLKVIEDAAHGLLATYEGQPLGSFGDLATLSFHETKNVQSGEGGALLVNDAELVGRAEVVQEKGTNRSQFFRGQAERYTWIDVGSSYLMSEVTAAFLWAQLQRAEWLTSERLRIWRQYDQSFTALDEVPEIRRPIIPAGRKHNAHLYHLLMRDRAQRTAVIDALGDEGIHAVFHYVPLHSSPGGARYGRADGDLVVTRNASDRLVRLPMWIGLSPESVERVVAAVLVAVGRTAAVERQR
jgi:dTDP-4-amino-4,6-dideoxygalactose transaminase